MAVPARAAHNMKRKLVRNGSLVFVIVFVVLALYKVTGAGKSRPSPDARSGGDSNPSIVRWRDRIPSSVNDPHSGAVGLQWNGRKVSYWHDVPIRQGEEWVANHVSFVCEIPRGSKAKMEIQKEAAFNPIQQDTRSDGSLRFYTNASIVNYGSIPQTWENPNVVDAYTSLKGDGDPLDVIEISDRVCEVGEIWEVSVVGVLGMMDGGEMDWKVVVVDVNSSLAAYASVLEMPPATQTFLGSVREWFRMYKWYTKRQINKFAFGGKYLGHDFAMKVVSEAHVQWQTLRMSDKSTRAASAKDYWVQTGPMIPT